MKSTNQAAGRKKAAWFCGGIFAAVLILLAFVFALRAYLDAPQTETVAATSAVTTISFIRMTTAEPETDALKSDRQATLPFARRTAETPETDTSITDAPETDAPEPDAPETEASSPEIQQSEAVQSEGTAVPSETAAASAAEVRRYILNTNTKKFHTPSCASVGTIKAENKTEYTGTRDDLLLQGYTPCKRCNP